MAKRKTKKKDKATETGILTIGLDIGYGVVKAITDQTAITFPSVAGHARDIKFQQDYLTEKYAGDQITDDHGQWFVG